MHEFLQKRLRAGAAGGGRAVTSSTVEALQKHQSVAKACLKNDTGVTLPALSDVVSAPSIAAAAVKDASNFARAIPKRPEVKTLIAYLPETSFFVRIWFIFCVYLWLRSDACQVVGSSGKSRISACMQMGISSFQALDKW